MNLVFPESITIASHKYTKELKEDYDGAAFFTGECRLEIGTKSLATDPGYTWMLICHELMAICCVVTNVRYNDTSVTDYLFVMSHKQFETAVCLFAQVSKEFLK